MSLTLEQLNALTSEDIERIALETNQTVDEVRKALHSIAYRLEYDSRPERKAARKERNAKKWQLTKAVKRSL
jgi:hypothetical protein